MTRKMVMVFLNGQMEDDLKECGRMESRMEKEAELVHILKSVTGSAIVYTRSRQGTKDIAKILSGYGISATFYHAGLDFAVKDQRQHPRPKNTILRFLYPKGCGLFCLQIVLSVCFLSFNHLPVAVFVCTYSFE